MISRDKEAWLNSLKQAKESAKPLMFVEGKDDIHFWKQYVDRSVVQIEQLGGWEKVKETVEHLDDNGMANRCLGVIDADFEHIHHHKGLRVGNIYLSDFHDLEMSLICSDAFAKMLQSIDKDDKLRDTEPQELLEEVFAITDRIGYIKLASAKKGHELAFKDRKGNPPDYAGILDASGRYAGDERLQRFCYDRSRNIRGGQKVSEADMKKDFVEVSSENYDSRELSNGHDVLQVLGVVLAKRYKLKKDYYDQWLIWSNLLSAYSAEMLQATGLHAAMTSWSAATRVQIWGPTRPPLPPPPCGRG